MNFNGNNSKSCLLLFSQFSILHIVIGNFIQIFQNNAIMFLNLSLQNSNACIFLLFIFSKYYLVELMVINSNNEISFEKIILKKNIGIFFQIKL